MQGLHTPVVKPVHYKVQRGFWFTRQAMASLCEIGAERHYCSPICQWISSLLMLLNLPAMAPMLQEAIKCIACCLMRDQDAKHNNCGQAAPMLEQQNSVAHRS